MTASAVCVAFSGTGLHPPAVPTDCGLIGAAQFLQTTPFAALVKPDRPANLASVEHGRDLAVRLLIQPEADRRPILLRLEAVQVAIRNLRQRNTHAPVGERNFGSGGNVADALGVHKFRRDQRDEHK